MKEKVSTTSLFRAMHARGFFVLPNAWDVGSAVRLASAGFRAIASTSAGAAWAAGKNDGELGLDETLKHLRLLVASVDLPINADFENGFADRPEEVAANAQKALETGIAGLSIEDWSGHHMYDLQHAVDRIAATREAMDAMDDQAVLIGRNENFRVADMQVKDSIARAVAYAQAGADCVFVPFVADHGAIRELVSAVAPKAVNVVLHDADNVEAMAALGVRRCSTGASLAKCAFLALEEASAKLRTAEQAAQSPADPPSLATS